MPHDLCNLVAKCLYAGTRSAAECRMLQILESLESPAERESCVAVMDGGWRAAADALPVERHVNRLESGRRGLSLPALRALRQFFEQRGALQWRMSELCRSDGVNFSACALTASTGLSLAETVVRRCKADGVPPMEMDSLVGRDELLQFPGPGRRRRHRLDPSRHRATGGGGWEGALRVDRHVRRISESSRWCLPSRGR